MAVTEGSIQVPPDSTGKIVDTNEMTRDSQTVERQNICVSDPETPAAIAAVEALGGVYAMRVARQPDWGVKHTPAAATQATISKAAGAAGTKHVCTSIAATLATAGTAQTVLKLQLRDGASGAGTIVWEQTILLAANLVWSIVLSGLNIIGSDATAMTLEFSGANVADSYASVAMTGYDQVAP
jgi:hypothetical protein